MIRYKEIAFVAYPVTDVARARKFYETVLNLKPNAPVKPEAPWIEYDIGTGTLGIGSSPQWLPSQDGASAALEVEDFDAAVATLREHKVPIIVGPMDLPSCRMATVRDPDGNKITLHQRKAHRDRIGHGPELKLRSDAVGFGVQRSTRIRSAESVCTSAHCRAFEVNPVKACAAVCP